MPEVSLSYYTPVHPAILSIILDGQAIVIHEKLKSLIHSGECEIFIVHDNDLDGVTASGLFRNYVLHIDLWDETKRAYVEPKITFNISPAAHGITFSKVLEETYTYVKNPERSVIIVLDHQLSKQAIETVNKNDVATIWIDHHEIKSLVDATDDKNTTPVIDDEKLMLYISKGRSTPTCTLSNVYEIMLLKQTGIRLTEMCLETYKLPVSIVEHYDTGQAFRTKDPLDINYSTEVELTNYAKAINAFFYKSAAGSARQLSPEAYGLSQVFLEVGEYGFMADAFFDFIAQGERIIEIKNEIVQAVVTKYLAKQTVEFLDIHPEKTTFQIGIVSHSDSMNEIAEYALKEDNTLDFIAVLYLKKREAGIYAKMSLRGRNDNKLDLNKLAARYGGGGHMSASGFEIPFNELVNTPFFTQG